MKRILFLFSEEFSANGVCAKAVIKSLTENGYEIECITNQEMGLATDDVIDNIRYSRIKPRVVYRLMKLSSNDAGKIIGVLAKFINKLQLLISIPTWPLISIFYTLSFYKKAKQVYTERPYDMVVSIYSQIDTLIAGFYIKKRYPSVKFVPYFLDSLSGGYGPKIFSTKWTIKRGLKWEGFLLKHADQIIVMKSSKAHHDKYSKDRKYYERMIFLDIPLLENRGTTISSDSNLNRGVINFTYAGSIPCHIRNPKYVLELYKRISIGECVFTIIGTNTCPDLFLDYTSSNMKNRIEMLGSLSHSQTISMLNQADFLINIGNNINSMVPSKVFEYMSMGKPIISTSSINDDASKKYLLQYPLSIVIEEDWDKIEQSTQKIETFVHKNLGKVVQTNEIRKLLYENTPEAFVDVVEKILN